MAGIAGAACSSDVLFGSREVGSDGASLAQFRGLRPVENMQLAPTGSEPSGSISTSASKSRTIRAMVSQTVSAPKREKDPKKRVVITGMGLVSVFGSGIDTFYDKLLEGESGISLIDRFDASSFSVRFAGQIRDFSSKGYIDGKNDRRLGDCWRRGEADIMVAGGTEASVIPTGVGGFIACRALSQRNEDPKKASRPWDKDRDGFVMGEGSGVLIMESLEHAMKRGANIIAEYLGGAVTCDAHHMTDPRSDGLGVSTCIAKSLEDAGVSPEEVNYANAHATSTLAGDLAEVNAIKKIFKNTSEIKMNGTKSMIGHGLGAAGALEAIATIKAINTGWLHPTINQDNIEY
ncbi:3-oxoacyl-[acyl-carrier-protein] synthase I [Populus alba x Populus x berolinensis]|uniref:beta-ketoacyl-[acyl-carrier-protein] synthase I n=1 Tax=Populus alba x Populus x berolinensis TaxID=444605 RepID=A0AAD6WF11_9ROSI|nr:3-oxoacyl-[acyl-carrier-protein] synthase I [Populus alba x Populus x berolinensis]